MIVAERKSRYKLKVTISNVTTTVKNEQLKWCENTFGKGGRKKRWRYGWIQADTTFYFREPKDATMFMLRWS
jgi:hypothetical protein